MVIDLKYHLTTIIAIFLALGIGILVGSAMIGTDGIVQEQQKLIVQIEDDLEFLRSQNNQYKTKVTMLEGRLDEQEQFVNVLFQDAIAGQLTGMHGLMIRDGTKNDQPENEQLIETLHLAGMKVTDFASVQAEVLEKDQELKAEHTEQWDFCFLLTHTVPKGLDQIFLKEQIFQPINEQISSKKGLYDLITNLRQKILVKNAEQEVEYDLYTDTGL